MPHDSTPHSPTRPLIGWALTCSLAGLVLGCQQTSDAPATEPSIALQSGISDPMSEALGIWRLSGDVADLSLSLEPLERQPSALADTFTVDITSLTGRFFRIKEIFRPKPDRLIVSFAFQHPLPNTAARRDLHIFDVRLHALSPNTAGSFGGPDGLKTKTGTNGADEGLALSGIRVFNADGWSSWGDEVVEPISGNLAPNVYPYWRIHEDTGRGAFDSAAPAGWNVLPMATTVYTTDLILSTAAVTSIDLLLAIEASYGASALGPAVTPLDDPGGRKNPRYFVPHFNLKEAWKAEAVVSGPIFIGAGSSSLDIDLTVFDHQGPLPAAGAFDPLTAPASSLRYESALSSATVALPGLLGSPATIPGSSFTGDGTQGNPYLGTITLTGDQLSGTAGNYTGLVALRDSHPGSALTLSPTGTIGIDRTLAPQARFDYAVYLPVTVTAQTSTNQAPTADLTALPTTVPSGGTTSLSPGPGTNDPDGAITLYEYDFDYDGSSFTVDTSNTTGAAVNSPALTGPGTRTMALRVTDDGAPALSAIDTALITIEAPTNQPPVADLDVTPTTVTSGQTVQCGPGAGTTDPDGTITLYEYDFDFDGITFNVDASNSNGSDVVTPPLTNGGASPIQRMIAMRVTDNGAPGLTDVDGVIVTINPVGPAPTWTQIHDKIANGPGLPGVDSCVSCHEFGQNGLIMNFDKQETYDNLVNVGSTCLDPYIVPNDAAGSFLYQKISQTTPLCGDRMPRSGPPYWDAANIQMVADWINAGAQNN